MESAFKRTAAAILAAAMLVLRSRRSHADSGGVRHGRGGV